jgi:Ca2+-transporting ATPase
VRELQLQYGKNEIAIKTKQKFVKKIVHIFSEPIYFLLSCSAIIYFLLGESFDGIIMIGFVGFVIGIDVLQNARTDRILRKLKEITTPKIKVIRDGREMMISGVDLVPGDVMLISEGVKIPADGYLLSATGLCVDESILTGESESVYKYSVSNPKEPVTEEYVLFRRDYCYTGTLVVLGSGTVIVEKTGNETEYGKLADKIKKTIPENTPLQSQMSHLAKQCTLLAAILFIIAGFVTFINLSDYEMGHRFIHSILAGIVLALSMVPGEFPVIQTVFLSMGALRLSKKNALVRSLPAVETLGAISVLCVDKTGTITQNRLMIHEFWANDHQEEKLCKTLTLACKEGTHDPLEIAMLKYGEELCSKCIICSQDPLACDKITIKPEFLKEYTFTNDLKAMGQVWHKGSVIVIAAKGSPETILSLCIISKDKEAFVKDKINHLTKMGLRVIAVADRTLKENERIPESLIECRLYLRGIIGLIDPPREEIRDNMKECYQAGIRIVMITGDHPVTALSIANNVGIRNENKIINGDEISKLNDEELRNKVRECNIFARVMPLHKLRIVKALKENGEIVAMTGDGVNDSPAQKMANIGIAMGKSGSEVCREAADLILLDDNFSTILETVEDGRRIYQNVRKAVAYVLSIHIPIALAALAAPLLRIHPEALLLLPLHIILLELVMDPTCSIALERQPAEDHIMQKPPRNPKTKLLTKNLFIKCLFQGSIIFMNTFILYYGLLLFSFSPEIARTSGFTALVLSNSFLVLVNCSELDSIIRIVKKLKKDKAIWLINAITSIILLIMIYSPFHNLLEFEELPLSLLVLTIVSSASSVLWYELFKIFLRKIQKV